MHLADNEFLKIVNLHYSLRFSLVEQRLDPRYSQIRTFEKWFISVPKVELYTRHTKTSKAKRLSRVFWALECFLQSESDSALDEVEK